MAPLTMKDIQNSPLNKNREEYNARDLDMKTGKMNGSTNPKPDIVLGDVPDHTKPVLIHIEKTTADRNGLKTTFSLGMDYQFTNATELKEVLDAVGYSRKTLWARIKTMFK